MAEFSDPMGAQLLSEEDTQAQFNNLVVDKNTGRVYIGGVNKLYQLSPKLEVMVSYFGCCFYKLHTIRLRKCKN